MNSPLQTDLYQLTMAAAYWRAGKHEQRSVFHLFFRKAPFKGSFAIAAGIQPAIEWLQDFKFSADEISYLGQLRTANGQLLFEPEFLKYLTDLELDLDVHGMPEGSLAFPHEPILRIEGPILHAQLVETALLNLVNFSTLIATKAARICSAAEGDPVLEFGYRRAQGPDGGLLASRSAYIGGCVGTSNVLAGQKYGIPVKGTHAHSWIMSFDDELEAFQTYANAMPDNSTLLVDTYDTLAGVEKAITVGKELRNNGHELSGIRLDSGDLAWLSQEARKRLDAAGFDQVKIVASNDLDEEIIETLKQQGAKIDIWGVGTNLVTAADQPALGGVYKLAALQETDASWSPRIKRSEQAAKSSIPGRLQVLRYEEDGTYLGDAIIDIDDPLPDLMEITSPDNSLQQKTIPQNAISKELLQPLMVSGEVQGTLPDLDTIRARVADELTKLPKSSQRLKKPHIYPAGLAPSLNQRRTEMLTNVKS